MPATVHRALRVREHRELMLKCAYAILVRTSPMRPDRTATLRLWHMAADYLRHDDVAEFEMAGQIFDEMSKSRRWKSRKKKTTRQKFARAAFDQYVKAKDQWEREGIMTKGEIKRKFTPALKCLYRAGDVKGALKSLEEEQLFQIAIDLIDDVTNIEADEQTFIIEA